LQPYRPLHLLAFTGGALQKHTSGLLLDWFDFTVEILPEVNFGRDSL
jgi:hypothetical protein